MPKNPDVDAWFETYDNPMKPVVLAVRDIVLAADRRLDECIKWKSPTFTFEGNLASFNPRSKKHASLMFHTGAKIPGAHPRLEGGGDTARYMTFATVAEAKAAKADLRAIVAAWCALKTGDTTGGGRAAKTASKKTASKKAAAKKKPTTKKKAATKKKTATKTAATKKKAASKPAATKKASAKKTTGTTKTPAAKRKVATKKKPATKASAKKKAAKRR